MPIKNPPHPGDFIRTEIIEAADLTVTAAAIASRVLRYPVCSMARPIYPGTCAPYRKSLWSKDGYADAYAIVLRHCPNAQARETNSSTTHFPCWLPRISVRQHAGEPQRRG